MTQRKPAQRLAVIALILVCLLPACMFFPKRWDKADEFVSGLRCGMSADEIRSYALRFPQCLTFEPNSPSRTSELVVQHEDTDIRCFLEGGKLRAVQVTWISRPMKRTVEEERPLCN